jgi:hypothetical protein
MTTQLSIAPPALSDNLLSVLELLLHDVCQGMLQE